MYMVRGMKRHWDATLDMTVDELLDKYDSEGGHVEENEGFYLWYLLKVRPFLHMHKPASSCHTFYS